MNTETRAALNSAHNAVTAEIADLEQRLEVARATKASLEEAMAVATGSPAPTGTARKGELPGAIAQLRATLPKTFRKRDVISALKQRGYRHSLSPNYVAKTMGRMVEGKVLAIHGDRNKATYQFR